ncbi:hypothetical protein [Amycolatopsis sp. CA-230715]|uniref:hypothetical protein n=1 Tax=Amycolatopsis sp. CA-230715 TaxID=2745196 RepID=UPI001C01634F|nr:hypothetical protein [Amycolatopsis sp. CA-230715]QWF81111.1 hypothetical protein HUW46_04537 [Amycolatopsis sp. CA-230715]
MRLTTERLLLAFLGAVVVLVWVTIGLAYDKPSDWWASGGQWAGAIGSVFAAGVALWIAQQGWSRADQERLDNQKVQARLIFALYQFHEGHGGGIKLVNASHGAVTRISIMRIIGLGRFQ